MLWSFMMVIQSVQCETKAEIAGVKFQVGWREV